MSEFVIVFTAPVNPAVLQRLKAAYPAAYEMIPQSVYLIRDSSPTAEIAVKVGIKSDPRVAEGAVFKLNHGYAGFTDRTLREWLGEWATGAVRN